MNDNDYTCELCGCAGNEECGAEPVDKDMGCALDSLLECQCCKKLGVKENKKRWKK